jgi:glucose/arabinose dehydrogenase
LCAFLFSSAHAESPQISKLKVPEGFKISVYSAPVVNARSMALAPDGTVFVGTRTEGDVYALLPDKDGDGKSDGRLRLFTGMDMPNGVAFKNGDLYIAEYNQIWVSRGILKNLKAPKKEKFGAKFPSEKHHGWKFIAFGPDGWLYVPVGAPCNICNEDPEMFAAIHRLSPDGKKRVLVAKGVRNTVGFDWQPGSKDFWFTENGRDWMGDDKPPCELNRLSKLKEHFGYPHCHGTDILDPEFGKGKSCKDFTPPKYEFTAHSAPLGMRFIKGGKSKIKGSVLVAEHGSWNRSTKVGYQVSKIEIDGIEAKKGEPFVTGFKDGENVWGRPVDILEMNDGSILISDDTADAVYRVEQTD